MRNVFVANSTYTLLYIHCENVSLYHLRGGVSLLDMFMVKVMFFLELVRILSHVTKKHKTTLPTG